jgi:hypothetical protein
VARKNERREIRFEDLDEGMVLKHITKEVAANEEGRPGIALVRRPSKKIPGIRRMVALDRTPSGSKVLNPFARATVFSSTICKTSGTRAGSQG